MKATIVLKILKVVFCAIYIFLLTLPNMINIWFSLFLVFISILLLAKAFVFMHDSKLWLGIFLLYTGCFNIIKYLANFKFGDIYWVYILTFGVASLHVFVVFRQKIHLKVFVFSAIQVLLLGILKFAYIDEFEFW